MSQTQQSTVEYVDVKVKQPDGSYITVPNVPVPLGATDEMAIALAKGHLRKPTRAAIKRPITQFLLDITAPSTLGGGIGAMVGGPVGAAVGGAAGGLVEGLGKKERGEKLALRTIGEGAVQGGIEGVFRGGGKLIKLATRGPIGKNISANEALPFIAREFGGEAFTPKRFGTRAQAAFDDALDVAIKNKGIAINNLITRNPKAHVNFSSTLEELRKQIGSLESTKSDFPSLFAADTGGGTSIKQKTLDILGELQQTLTYHSKPGTSIPIKDELGRVTGSRTVKEGNLAFADKIRSELFNLRQNMEPSTAERVIGKLNKTLTDDISATTGKEEAAQYIASGNRIRQLKDISESPLVNRVLGQGRVLPEQAGNILKNAPETTLDIIRAISPTDPQAVPVMRRAFLESMVETNKLPNVGDVTMKELFGPDAEKITKFRDLMREASTRGGLGDFLSIRIGNIFRVGESMQSPVKKMSARSLVDILDNPLGADAVFKIWRAPIKSETAAQAARTLVMLIHAQGALDLSSQPPVDMLIHAKGALPPKRTIMQ